MLIEQPPISDDWTVVIVWGVCASPFVLWWFVELVVSFLPRSSRKSHSYADLPLDGGTTITGTQDWAGPENPMEFGYVPPLPPNQESPMRFFGDTYEGVRPGVERLGRTFAATGMVLRYDGPPPLEWASLPQHTVVEEPPEVELRTLPTGTRKLTLIQDDVGTEGAGQ